MERKSSATLLSVDASYTGADGSFVYQHIYIYTFDIWK